MRILITTTFSLMFCLPAASGLAEDPAKAMLGRAVENFTLRDYRGKEHSLDDYSESELIVVAVLGTECPLARLYAPRLARMATEFESRGVTFLGLNANRHDSITEIAAYAQRHEIPFPILKDLGNRVADLLSAARTPEVFVLDGQLIVRYHGRIDDQYGVGYVRDEPIRRDLQIALEELLAGEAVSLPVTQAVGCIIGRVREPDPDSDVTYSNRIAGILQARCIECHRTGQIAPFALTEYGEVVGWAEMIAEVVSENRMPPWHASAAYGEFSNERRLSEDEKATIIAWADAGAPEGDAIPQIQTEHYVDDWQLPREPDLTFDIQDEPFVVPAEEALEYQYFTVDPELTEDTWVQAGEIRPGNPAVVHHILMWVVPPEGTLKDIFSSSGKFLFAYVPGLSPVEFPPGMAKLVPAGSKFVFQTHYTPIGTEQLDHGRVGLVRAESADVTTRVITRSAEQHKLVIPPGAPNHPEEATTRSLPRDSLLLGMMAHAHLRGKSFRYEALYPDGTTEILLDIPHYDFNWQTYYRLDEPKLLPAETRIHCIAHYDNSPDNLSNPDPADEVRWGNQTWDEMLIGYFDIAVPRTESADEEDSAEP